MDHRHRESQVARVGLSRRDELFQNDGLCRAGVRVKKASSEVLSVLLEQCVDGDPKSYELGEPADQDGCAPQVFDYMWARDRRTGKPCPSFRLPHTIVFRHGRPSHWYFTSVVDGELKRKRRVNLTNRNIHATFVSVAGARARDPGETAAIYVYTNSTSKSGRFRGKSESNSNANVEDFTVVEHITFGDLLDFLNRRPKEHGSILQQFITPMSERNHMLSVAWSPGVTVMEQRVSSHAMLPANRANDRKVARSNRLLTLEGSEIDALSAPIKSLALQKQLIEIAEKVALHTAYASSKRVRLRRLLLFFKLDTANKLHFLFCASMRYEPAPSAPTLVALTDPRHHATSQREGRTEATLPKHVGASNILYDGGDSQFTQVLGRTSSAVRMDVESADYRVHEIARIQALWRGQQARRRTRELRLKAYHAKKCSGCNQRSKQNSIVDAESGVAPADEADGATSHNDDGAVSAPQSDAAVRAPNVPRSRSENNWCGGFKLELESALRPKKVQSSLGARPQSAPHCVHVAANPMRLVKSRLNEYRPISAGEHHRAILMGPLNMGPVYRPPSTANEASNPLFTCPSCERRTRSSPANLPFSLIVACGPLKAASKGLAHTLSSQSSKKGSVDGNVGASEDVVESKSAVIPPLLRKLIPEMTEEDFERKRTLGSFLGREAEVCEDCYLTYVDVAYGDEASIVTTSTRHGHLTCTNDPGNGNENRTPDAECHIRPRHAGASCISVLSHSRSAVRHSRVSRPGSGAPMAKLQSVGLGAQPTLGTAGASLPNGEMPPPLSHSTPPRERAGLTQDTSAANNDLNVRLGHGMGAEERFNARLVSALALDARPGRKTRADFHRYGGVGMMLTPQHFIHSSCPGSPAISRRPHTAPRARSQCLISDSWEPPDIPISDQSSSLAIIRQPCGQRWSAATTTRRHPRPQSAGGAAAALWKKSPYSHVV